MINNILKIGLLITTGRFLKPRLKGLLILIVFWIMVRFLHAEYIGYVQLAEDTRYLWQASVLKIVLYLAGFVLYVVTVERSILLQGMEKQLGKARAKRASQTGGDMSSSPAEPDDDGFDFLREKKTLSDKSEQLLGK